MNTIYIIVFILIVIIIIVAVNLLLPKKTKLTNSQKKKLKIEERNKRFKDQWKKSIQDAQDGKIPPNILDEIENSVGNIIEQQNEGNDKIVINASPDGPRATERLTGQPIELQVVPPLFSINAAFDMDVPPPPPPPKHLFQHDKIKSKKIKKPSRRVMLDTISSENNLRRSKRIGNANYKPIVGKHVTTESTNNEDSAYAPGNTSESYNSESYKTDSDDVQPIVNKPTNKMESSFGDYDFRDLYREVNPKEFNRDFEDKAYKYLAENESRDRRDKRNARKREFYPPGDNLKLQSVKPVMRDHNGRKIYIADTGGENYYVKFAAGNKPIVVDKRIKTAALRSTDNKKHSTHHKLFADKKGNYFYKDSRGRYVFYERSQIGDKDIRRNTDGFLSRGGRPRFKLIARDGKSYYKKSNSKDLVRYAAGNDKVYRISKPKIEDPYLVSFKDKDGKDIFLQDTDQYHYMDTNNKQYEAFYYQQDPKELKDNKETQAEYNKRFNKIILGKSSTDSQIRKDWENL